LFALSRKLANSIEQDSSLLRRAKEHIDRLSVRIVEELQVSIVELAKIFVQ